MSSTGIFSSSARGAYQAIRHLVRIPIIADEDVHIDIRFPLDFIPGIVAKAFNYHFANGLGHHSIH
jgi:hypothetical protein